jgi:hypothetical protein
MIKLKTLIEHIADVKNLFESPMRIGQWKKTNLDDNSGNFALAKYVKENGKYIDTFNSYKVFELIKGKEIHTIFSNSDFISAYFVFENVDGYLKEKIVWQDFLCKGLARKLFFDYFLLKVKGIISDDLHSQQGEKYWKKNLIEAKQRNHKIYVLHKGNKLSIDNVNDIDKYYSHGISGGDYRFIIEK